ncbi:reverse transcriptase domain-containing protein [Tanacetum coccineum]
MKCLKMQFKYTRSLTCGASILWDDSPSSRGNKYILVAVDYFSKWVEEKTLPTNDARVVVKFLKSLFALFGTPRVIISDRGTHFCNDQFAKVMLKYGVTHRLSTAYHPQMSGNVEVSNRGLKHILERTIGEIHASWSDKLDDALWAFHTSFKTPIGCTPYKLVYEKACHLPIELEHKAYWALKHCNFDLKTAGDHRKVQMNELNELQDLAYENSLIYKEKMKKICESKIKNRIFNVGNGYSLMDKNEAKTDKTEHGNGNSVLIEARWFLIAASVEARISLIMLKFSSCLLVDSAMNLVSDSSKLGLRSGYEEFHYLVVGFLA